MDSAWLDQRFRRAGAPFSLYCFPYAGGAASYYTGWNSLFGGLIELVPIQLPGRGPRVSARLPASVDAIADEVAEVIGAGPARALLFGHSMGAILAFEVARRLDQAGCGAEALIVSGRPAPPITAPATRVSGLPADEFISVVRGYGAATTAIFEHQELLELLLPMMRADFDLIEKYSYTAGRRLSCPVLAWCGTDDHDVPPEVMERWQEETTGPFRLSVRSGGHFFIDDHHPDIVAEIHALASCLASASSG